MSDSPKLTPAQRHVLRHTLGLDHSTEPYRNRYTANVGDPLIAELVRLGLMEPAAWGHVNGEMVYEKFRCTDAGVAAAQEGTTNA